MIDVNANKLRSILLKWKILFGRKGTATGETLQGKTGDGRRQPCADRIGVIPAVRGVPPSFRPEQIAWRPRDRGPIRPGSEWPPRSAGNHRSLHFSRGPRRARNQPLDAAAQSAHAAYGGVRIRHRLECRDSSPWNHRRRSGDQTRHFPFWHPTHAVDRRDAVQRDIDHVWPRGRSFHLELHAAGVCDRAWIALYRERIPDRLSCERDE